MNPERTRTPLDLAETIRRTRAGSSSALAELYRLHAPMVMRVSWRILGSREDAEDVTHDVFVGLPEALRRYTEQGGFDRWLGRVTARFALSRLRHREGRRENELDAAASQLPVAATHDAAELAEARDAITALPDSLRVVFVLRELEGYTHREIAEIVGITARASEVKLSRAFKLLRERLHK